MVKRFAIMRNTILGMLYLLNILAFKYMIILNIELIIITVICIILIDGYAVVKINKIK